MFSLSVLVLMTSFVLGICKPLDEMKINNEFSAEIEEDVKTDLESVKAAKGSKTDNLEAAVPDKSNDEESSKSGNAELENKSGSDETSGKTKVKDNTKSGKEVEPEESDNKTVTVNEKAGNVGNEESESSSSISKKQVRSATDESATLEAENKPGLEKSSKENTELKEEPRSAATENVTKSGAIDLTSDDKKESGKTGNTELGNDKNQRKVKTEDELIKKQVRSASKNADKETDGKEYTESLEQIVAKDHSTINLEKSEIQAIKHLKIPKAENVYGKTGESITNHDISAIKQNDRHESSRSGEHTSFKLNQSAEKKSSIPSDTASAKLAIDDKAKIASLESHFKDNGTINFINELTSLKALQKRFKNSSLENGETVSKAVEEGSLKETDETINELNQGLSDNKDFSLERSKKKPTFLLDAPTRRSYPDESHLLKTAQDKSARPLLEFSNEDEFIDTRSGEQQKIQPGYHRHNMDVSIEAKKRLLNFPVNNYNGRAGIPFPNVMLQTYHPLTFRPLPQNIFGSPSLRVFRSPIQGIRKISDETVLPTSPGFPPGFILPNRHSFPHSGYNPQTIPPFETLGQNILAQNIHYPMPPQTHDMQEFKPILQQNHYNFEKPKSVNFDDFKGYLNRDDDNPQIEDYTSVDRNAYIYQSNKLNTEPRENQFSPNWQHKLTRASNHPEVLQKQGSQHTVLNFHEF